MMSFELVMITSYCPEYERGIYEEVKISVVMASMSLLYSFIIFVLLIGRSCPSLLHATVVVSSSRPLYGIDMFWKLSPV